MATYQRVDLKRIIRQRTDLENTTFETDVELNGHINDAAAALHDLLISCAGSSYAVDSSSFNTSPSTTTYSLASNPDILQLVRVSTPFDDLDYPISRYEKEGIISKTVKTSWGPGYLPRYNARKGIDGYWEIEFEPPPDKVTPVNLLYHVQPPEYTTDADYVRIPFADYIVVEACLRIKDKEDRDTLRLERERAAIQKRIEDWGATFDQANPPRTVDAPSRYSRAIWRRERVF